MKALLTLSLVFFANSALANVEVLYVDGASSYHWTSGHDLRVMGGLAGEEATCVPQDREDTCNSCLNNAHTECNPTRIYGTLELDITVRAKDTFSGQHRVLVTLADGTVISRDSHFSRSVIGPGDYTTFTATWGELCDFFDSTADGLCTESHWKQIRIGVDADASGTLDSGEYFYFSLVLHDPASASSTPESITCGDTEDDGICSFGLEPARGRAYVTDLLSIGSYPLAGNVRFTKVRFFYLQNQGAETEFSNINYQTPTFQDINITESADLESNRISNLSNTVIYSFKVAMIDEANNMSLITDNREIAQTKGCEALSTPYNAKDAANCPYLVLPEYR